MIKKKYFFGILCLAILFLLTACGNKTAIATSKFASTMEKKGYTITDVSSQYSTYKYINEATVAQSPDGWQIEFYVLDNNANTKGMFNTNQKTFEAYKESSSAESSVNLGNYSTYTLTSAGYYMYLCRVDNTLLYVKVASEFKNTIKDLVKELGY